MQRRRHRLFESSLALGWGRPHAARCRLRFSPTGKIRPIADVQSRAPMPGFGRHERTEAASNPRGTRAHSHPSKEALNGRDHQGKRTRLILSVHRKDLRQAIAHWMDILENLGPLKHMDLVNYLKAHQVGHRHANALVAAFLATK